MQGHVRKRHKPDCAKRRHPAGTPVAVRRQTRCSCDGSWQGRYRDPIDPSKFIERTFRTKVEAEDWLTSQQASMMTGTHVSPRLSETPFAEVVAAWKESWPNRLSPTTARRYESILSTYLIPAFGQVPVGRIDHGAVQRFINKLSAQTGDDAPAPGTIRNVFAVLRTAMASGVRLGMVRVNPCTNINLPRANREPMLFLTADEVRKLAETIDPHYKTLIWTAAITGLRAGELAGLQRQDVDLLRGVIHVRRSIRDVNGVLELGSLKTEYSRRTVSIPKFLSEMLRDHLTEQTKGGTGPDAPVFTMKSGGVLRMGLVYSNYFRRAAAGWTDKRNGEVHPGALPAAKAGLRFHDLRHTAASLAIAAGEHPKAIQARLGHSSITVTLDRYGHLMPGQDEALAKKLDAMFEPAAPEPSNVKELRTKEG